MSYLRYTNIPTYYDTKVRYYLRDGDTGYLEFTDEEELRNFYSHHPEFTSYSIRYSIPNASNTIKTGIESWGFSYENKRIPPARYTSYADAPAPPDTTFFTGISAETM